MTDDVFVIHSSFAQRSMWLQHQMDPAKPICNITAAARISGPLRTEALRRALNLVVERHETLRTVFRLDGTALVQVIRARMDVPLPVTDLHPSEIDAEVQREAETSFEVDHGPLLRMRLLRLGPDDHILVLVMHHIIMDGWSSAIMFRELSAFYQSCLTSQDPGLPALPIQYGDYAVWQRERLSGPWLDRLLGYWTSKLAGAQPLLLPTDRSCPAVRANRGETVTISLPADLMAALERLARGRRATLFMVLLAALQGLFAQYSGQDDITIATAVANRDRPETTGLIGHFVNTLALRTDVSGTPTVVELIDRARATCQGAFAHQEMPFEKVVEAVKPERDGGGVQSSLARAMLLLQNMPTEQWKVGGLVFEPMKLDTRVSILDISFTVEPTRDGAYSCLIEYSTDLFNRTTIDHLARSYQRMLDAFATNPDRPVDLIEAASDRDWTRLLNAWNATTQDPPDGLVHELISRQAARTPTAVAVEDRHVRLTYEELEHRSDQVAAVLRSLPFRGTSEPMVGIAMTPSVELAVAVLGTLKSGTAFVPLDPYIPAARLTEMVRDSGVEVVLTQDALARTFAGHRVICLDQERLIPDHTAGASVVPRPESVACVLYTSGSTNTPKGVMFEHGALANFAQYIAAELALTENDRYFQLSSIGFDTFLEELFPALVAGATVVFPDGRILATGEDLTAHIEERGVTVVDLTPAYWHVWTRELAARGGPPRTLRLAVVGGDRVIAECVETWQRFGVDLIEVYGLTETTVTSTTSHQTEARPHGPGPGTTIGRPLANTRVYVLDERLRPVPGGAVGELYIGGIGLARGYLGKPAMTAERFIPDPFGPPGVRMYRTGDRARRRPDGEVEFIGRVDHQIKLRGQRVDLGEIEAVVADHPAVTQAVVLAIGDDVGKRLIAYIASETAPDPAHVRAFVAEILPEFVVPSAVIVFASMPMNSNGKVDRRALAAMDVPVPPVSRRPTGWREELLCRVFAEVTGVATVGAEDDFFELGGDSISAIQLASRAREAGVMISPRDVFTRRTPARLSAAAGSPTPIAVEEPDAGFGPMPLTPPACWLAGLGGGTDTYSQAMLFRVPASLDEGVVAEALQCLVDHHDALRTILKVQPDGRWDLEIARRGTVRAGDWIARVDVADLSERRRCEVILDRAESARRQLNPRAGVMGQAVWFDAGEERGRLLLVLHHLVVDGVSWRILLPDFSSAYNARAAGLPVNLQPVHTSYRQWAQALTRAASDPSLTSELRYWRDTLRTSDPLIGSRPLDSGRDVAGTLRTFTTTAGPEVAEPLLTDALVAHRAGADDVLLTALAMAMGRWRSRRGHQDSAVLLEFARHGRDEAAVPGVDLSRTVGWFTSIVPVALDAGKASLTGAANPIGAFKRVKEQLRAVPGSGIGYDLLRHLTAGTASILAELPSPQIGFNYLGRLRAADVADGDWTLDTELMVALDTLDPDMPVPHALEITTMAQSQADGLRLTATWMWAPGVLSEPDVRELADDWHRALAELRDHL